MIDRAHELPLAAQCRLLRIARGCLYYRPTPVSETDLRLMRRIDELHLAFPFFGSRRLRVKLREDGFDVGRRCLGVSVPVLLVSVHLLVRDPFVGHRLALVMTTRPTLNPDLPDLPGAGPEPAKIIVVNRSR